MISWTGDEFYLFIIISFYLFIIILFMIIILNLFQGGFRNVVEVEIRY
jgi:hypothetical protein